jgi:hypothetical protein
MHAHTHARTHAAVRSGAECQGVEPAYTTSLKRRRRRNVLFDMMVGHEVKFQPLGDDNYGTWSTRMQAMLVHHRRWKYIESPATDSSSLEDKEGDADALALITMNVTDMHLPTIKQSRNAAEAWETLELAFNSQTEARSMQLMRQLLTLKMQPEETITTYAARAQGIWTALMGINKVVEEAHVTSAFLNGLPKQYHMTRQVIVNGVVPGHGLRMRECVPKLLVTEQWLRDEEGDGDASALVMTRFHSKKKTHHYNTSEGSQKTFQKRAQSKTDKKCYYCGKPGHFRDECRKKAADEKAAAAAEEQLKEKRRPVVSFATAYVADVKKKAHKDEWVLDSGASHHMSPDAEMMINYEAPTDDTMMVRIGDGRKMKVCGIGDVLISTVSMGEQKTLHLKRVLHVPELKMSLMSAR